MPDLPVSGGYTPVLSDGYPSLLYASGGVPDRGANGVGFGVHFNRGNPSELHGQPAVTGMESEKEPAGTTPYNEPLVVSALVRQPMTCADNCAEQERLARVHCDIIRKRVAQWMKDTGCASSVRGFKQKCPKGKCCKKKSSAKYYTIDYNGDGIADAVAVDYNNDKQMDDSVPVNQKSGGISGKLAATLSNRSGDDEQAGIQKLKDRAATQENKRINALRDTRGMTRESEMPDALPNPAALLG